MRNLAVKIAQTNAAEVDSVILFAFVDKYYDGTTWKKCHISRRCYYIWRHAYGHDTEGELLLSPSYSVN